MLGAAPVNFHTDGVAAVGSSANGASAQWWLSAWFAIPFLIVVVLLSRLTSISINSELNPDESQMLAQAMRIGIDPVPWRGMDGTTSGPVNSWALFVLHKLGMPLRHSHAHAVAAAILASLSVLTYATLRQVGSKSHAFIGAGLTAFVITLAQDDNFTHFTSELISAQLMAMALFCCALRFRFPMQSIALDCASGLMLGIIPWAKLQSILGAGALAMWLGWQIWRGSFFGENFPNKRFKHLIAFGAAFLLPAILMMGVIINFGAVEDFWGSYIQTSMAYSSADRNGSSFLQRAVLLFTKEHAGYLSQSVGLFALAWGVCRFQGWKTAILPAKKLIPLLAGMAIITAVAVLKPPYLFSHYGILLFQPLTLLAGCILAAWKPNSLSLQGQRFPAILLILCFAGVHIAKLSPPILYSHYWNQVRPDNKGGALRLVSDGMDAIAPDIKSLVVWGWMPSLYVEKGIAPATRHAICHFLIDPGPAQARLREGFLSDIRREKPDMIVDVVAGGCFRWYWDCTRRMGCFPELLEYVQTHYVLSAELGVKSPVNPVRFYLSREYLAGRARLEAE